MVNELIELVAERLIPKRWDEYQSARYDYCGWISEAEAFDYSKAEFWGKKRGVRYRPVCVVYKNGKRYRVW